MNAKLLFLSTVALALASTFAMADEARDVDVQADGKASTQTRVVVQADMVASRKANTLLGPMRNKTYNAYESDVQRPSSMTREEVRGSVLAAAREGSLRHSDYDGVPVTVARRAGRGQPTTPVLEAATLRSPG